MIKHKEQTMQFTVAGNLDTSYNTRKQVGLQIPQVSSFVQVTMHNPFLFCFLFMILLILEGVPINMGIL